MTFEKCLDFVFAHEGGDHLVNDPRDPGGPTKYGIAQNYHADVDVRSLTREGAARIYRDNYWIPTRCDELPPILRLAIFDAAVNGGCSNSIRFLQRGLRIPVDGVVGAITIRAALSASAETLSRVLTERVLFYGNREGLGVYGRGWIERCFDLQRTVLG